MNVHVRRARRSRAALLAGLLIVMTACGRDAPRTARERPATSSSSSTVSPSSTIEASTSADAARRSTGCGRAADVPPFTGGLDGDAPVTFSSGGIERTYRLGVPVGYDPDRAAPLVLQLHGRTATALKIDRYTGLASAATERDMVVVTPDAIDTIWDVQPDGRDGEFIDALLDDVMSRYCIDLDDVHAAGMSLGAWRAAGSACVSGRFASIALVALDLIPTHCQPVSVVAIHGTADEEIPYGDGGGTVDPATGAIPNLPGALQNMAGWAGNDGCSTEPVIETIGSDVTLRHYPGCVSGHGVELYTVVGGGHSWPSPATDLAPDTPTTLTIDATDIVLDFFDSHGG